jgi:hypothetical protein
MSGPAIANPFDSAPVAAPDPSTGGAAITNPFDMASNQQAPPQAKPGFLEGLYDSTIGGVVSAAKNAPPQPTPTVGSIAAHVVAGPVADVLDPNHPVWGILNSAVAQAKAAIAHGIKAARAEGRGVSALARGNFDAANSAGMDVADESSQAAGHALAAQVPVLGGAAAKAGEDFKDNPAYAAGESTGVIGQALLPEAVRGAGKGISAVAEGTGKVASGIKGLVSDIPGNVESKLVSTIGDAAESAGLERPQATTLKESVSDLGNKFKARAQTVYEELDSEAPGFQSLRDKIGQLQKSYRVQLNLDPVKSEEIAGQLKTAQQNMDELLTPGQKAQWKMADTDYARYKAIQQFGIKTAKSAEDLTNTAVTSVDKLHSAAQGLTNATRGGNPIDMLSRAFGEHAEDIRSIIQKGTDITSHSQAAKQLLKWLAYSTPIVGGTAYGASKLASVLSSK